MATSLAFGVLFATFLTLILVPVLYLVMADLKTALASLATWFRHAKVAR